MKTVRVINTKGGLYELSDDEQGVPVEEAFPGTKLPGFLKGARIYDIDGETVVTRPVHFLATEDGLYELGELDDEAQP